MRTMQMARVLVGLLSWSGGCDEGTEEIDTSIFEVNSCSVSGVDVLSTVTPAAAADFIEVRMASAPEENLGAVDGPWTYDEIGVPCAGAAEPDACTAALAELPLSSDFVVPGPVGYRTYMSVAYSRGDEVGSITSTSELLEFLGQVDSVGEAVLLTILDGEKIACDSEPDVGEVDGGFVVHTRTGIGCGGDPVIEKVVRISESGDIDLEQTVIVDDGKDDCGEQFDG